MILKRFIIVLVPILLNAASHVNDIQGTVSDANSGEALPYANIMVKGTNRGTVTDTDGGFVLVNEPAMNI